MSAGAHVPSRPVHSLLCDAGCIRAIAGVFPPLGRFLCRKCLEALGGTPEVE